MRPVSASGTATLISRATSASGTVAAAMASSRPVTVGPSDQEEKSEVEHTVEQRPESDDRARRVRVGCTWGGTGEAASQHVSQQEPGADDRDRAGYAQASASR